MKSLIAAAGLTLCWASAAFAMNWEGHDDDWMKDLPHALDFKAAVGAAPPKPDRRPCVHPDDVGKVPENVYDQVPLRHQVCAGQPPDAKPTQ
jgi:hypothetical protein